MIIQSTELTTTKQVVENKSINLLKHIPRLLYTGYMFDNQSFQHMNEALTLKSVLQEVSARETGGVIRSSQPKSSQLMLKEFDVNSGQTLPLAGTSSMNVSFPIQNGQLVKIMDEAGNSLYSQVVIPETTTEGPYLKRLSTAEIEKFKGTRHSVEIIHSANILSPAITKPHSKHILSVFYEPAERLIFAIYNRILHSEHPGHSAKSYITELVIILIMAFLGLLFMWYQAIAQL